jgi:MFS family permease
VPAVEPELVVTQVGVNLAGQPILLGWGGLGRRFARYWAAATLSFYGDWFTTVALVVLLYQLSGPAAPAGYMLARVVPRVLSSGIGGAFADRFSTQHVVAACALIQALFTISIIPASRLHYVWAVYGAVVITQFAGGVARPGVGALVPRIAPPQRLQRANALYSLGFSSSIAVGPALAAPLLLTKGPEACLAIDAATFVIAAILMGSLRVGRARGAPASVTQGALAGVRAVWGDPLLRVMAAGWMGSALAVTATSSVLVLIARNEGNIDWVGYLYAAVGGGSVLIGLVVLRYRPDQLTRDTVVGLAIAELLCIAVLTLHLPLWGGMLALGLSGVVSVMWETWATTDMQMRVNPNYLGRVNAAIVLSASAGMFIGALLALTLVPWAGWERALFTACIVSLLILGGSVVFGPQGREASEARSG